MREGLDVLRKKRNFSQLVFLKQTHGVDGALVTSKGRLSVTSSSGLDDLNVFEPIFKPVDVWSCSGDFIVSNKKRVGLGALTADCLPVILLDCKKGVFSIVHAGWRGSVKKICIRAIEVMQKNFESKKEDLKIYFGPCARECCYEVKQNFIDDLSREGVNTDLFVIKRSEKTFFDIVRFNKQQLNNYGVLDNQIIDEHCLCTVCNGQFCSYRRGNDYRRQATVVMVK